jgi:hypothetical protein
VIGWQLANGEIDSCFTFGLLESAANNIGRGCGACGRERHCADNRRRDEDHGPNAETTAPLLVPQRSWVR